MHRKMCSSTCQHESFNTINTDITNNPFSHCLNHLASSTLKYIEYPCICLSLVHEGYHQNPMYNAHLHSFYDICLWCDSTCVINLLDSEEWLPAIYQDVILSNIIIYPYFTKCKIFVPNLGYNIIACILEATVAVIADAVEYALGKVVLAMVAIQL